MEVLIMLLCSRRVLKDMSENNLSAPNMPRKTERRSAVSKWYPLVQLQLSYLNFFLDTFFFEAICLPGKSFIAGV